MGDGAVRILQDNTVEGLFGGFVGKRMQQGHGTIDLLLYFRFACCEEGHGPQLLRCGVVMCLPGGR